MLCFDKRDEENYLRRIKSKLTSLTKGWPKQWQDEQQLWLNQSLKYFKRVPVGTFYYE